jgi:hypothetical protein
VRGRGGGRSWAALGALLLALAALSLPGALGAPRAGAAVPEFTVGYGDSLFRSTEAEEREEWFGKARQAGGRMARIDVLWSQIAPLAVPAGFEASNPASPGYEWEALDESIRGAAAHHLRILLTVYSAPRWAEAPGRPSNLPRGTWRPSAGAFGEFAHALAERYDGSFADPLRAGVALPRVGDFEAWNEPNLNTYLNPQWEGRTAVAPTLYRELLDRFYAGVKGAQPGATVIAGSLAPFGDPPGGQRVRPVLFLRELLCLRGNDLAPVSCPEPARFDVLSDHPIAVGPPDQHAVNALDATTPDLGRLTKVLEKAEATGRVLPAGHKPLWVTEFWTDTSPPDPNGIPIAEQARWYEQDLYLFWQQGASVAICLQVRDAPPGRSYASSLQAGTYFLDGSPKPSRTAMRFPFVAHRTGPFEVKAWGIAPRAGQVKIQALRDGGWKTLATARAGGAGRPFTQTVKLLRFAKLRARIGGETSLAWSQR